ncbi:hypothetical protein C1H76_3754 [Elsinoe australis]|uniref:Rhodopsin domain-containing protein n=1 Tax=Elsinoe australis TaxID=40998 RepID=A0A4U7B4X6_9PEZI|nr:hypothetical protein C1H76_3754 [Elsinoe australis]
MLPPITHDEAQTANYVCVSLAVVFLAIRLLASKFQPKAFDASFFVTVFALCVLIGRLITTYFTLTFDTAADAVHDAAQGHPFSEEKLSHIKEGTIFSLFNRVLETTFWWTQSVVILLLYRRLVSHIKWTKHAINATWLFIGCSYLAVVITIFLECTPFSRYYQVSPPPGQCVKGYKQTLIQCLSNIVIDIALIAVAIPVVFIQGRQTTQRLRIGALIALGIFATIVTCVRLAYIFSQGSLQATRSFWAGIQILVSGFVANAPIIYGSLKLWRKEWLKSKSAGEGYAMTSTGRPSRTSRVDRTTERKGITEDMVNVTRTYVVETTARKSGDGDSETGLV